MSLFKTLPDWKFMKLRSVNWLDHTVQSLIQHFPELQRVSLPLVERLSALLLERLPPQLSLDVLGLLPEEVLSRSSESLKEHATSESDRSIGYPDFVQRAAFTLGCANFPE